MMLAACNNNQGAGDTDEFTLNGTAKGYSDGEKLLLTNHDGEPIDTFVISNEAFHYVGKTDSVQQYIIYELENQVNNVAFFTEAGTINVTLSRTPGKSTVSGTVSNDAWQKLSDELQPYYDKMQQLEDSLYSGRDLSREAAWVIVERYQQLFSEINKKVIRAAEANSDNEFGYFIIATYNADDEPANSEVRKIISSMPSTFRMRAPIRMLEAKLMIMEATEVGHPTPDFTMRNQTGDSISLLEQARKNRLTIVDFWASWCGPCRQEMPFMRELYSTYHNQGLGIVGISLDEDSSAWKQAITSLKMEWPQMSDLKGWENDAARTYSIVSIPYVVVLDSAGTIIDKGIRGNKLKQLIEHYMQQ